MNIQFGNYFKITSDERQFIIHSRNDRKPDEKSSDIFTTWGDPRHYTSMEGALTRLLELMLLAKRPGIPEIESVDQLRRDILAAKEEIIQVCRLLDLQSLKGVMRQEKPKVHNKKTKGE